jgi:ribosome-binding protein aMBF1 (putative translation factor)
MPIAIFLKSKSGVTTEPVLVLGLMQERPLMAEPVEAELQHQEEVTSSRKSARRTAWGEIVRSIRIEQGLSQRQLAELSGVNRNVLRRLENEGGSSTVEVLERLLEIVGYDLEAICITKSLN